MRKLTIKPNWSVVLLGVSLATLAGIAVQAYQADRRHRETALALLRDYASFAVFNYNQNLANGLRSAADAALHSFGPWPRGGAFEAATLARVSSAGHSDCNCRMTNAVGGGNYLYSVATDSLIAGSQPRPGPANDVIAAVLRKTPRQANASEPVLQRVDANRWLTFRTISRSPTDTVLYAVWFDQGHLQPVFKQAFCPDVLLPPTLARGLPLDSIVSVAVYAQGDAAPLWSSRSELEWHQPAEDTLGAYYAALVVRASIRKEAAPSLIIGGLPRSRMPQLFALFMISAGLVLAAAKQIGRERGLVRMRERFVTSVSHELRTPLAQIRLFLETLRLGRAGTNAEREWALSHIERESTRLSHLVENVLHVSKPRAPATAAAPVIEIDSELADIVAGFLPLARSRRAHIVSSFEPGVLAAIRSEHLRQIMLNLLDNAVKYGPVGQTIRVSARTAADRVQITVSDQGPGVPTADQSRIWDAFQRGSSEESLATGGTGIGLTIARELTRQYGGSVELAAVDTGASFLVELPRIRVGPRGEHDIRAAVQAS